MEVEAPILVQTMTNTLTSDVKATVDQIRRVIKVGADIVRVSVPDKESSSALKEICKKVDSVPIIADIHFHYQRAIESAKNGASCLRINPGNIGSKEKIKDVIKAAKDYNCSIRIGVNGGSLEKNILEKFSEPNPEALVESALNNIKILEDNDFFNFKVSVKASDIFLAVKAYEKLSDIWIPGYHHHHSSPSIIIIIIIIIHHHHHSSFIIIIMHHHSSPFIIIHHHSSPFIIIHHHDDDHHHHHHHHHLMMMMMIIIIIIIIIIISHHSSSFIDINHHSSSFIIIHHHSSLLFIVIRHHHSSFIIIHHHSSSSSFIIIIIHHHSCIQNLEMEIMYPESRDAQATRAANSQNP